MKVKLFSYHPTNFTRLLFCSSVISMGLALQTCAQITVDGTLDAGYGGPLTTQTINTGFGDSSYTASVNGPDANGSELDAAYGLVSGGNLYLFLSGNIENNGNCLNIFIADGRAGQNTLNADAGSSPINAMNGSVFSPGFNATLALNLNDYQGTLYVNQADLVANTGSYLGSVPLTAGIGSGTLGGITFGLNNSNTGGVNGNGGTAATAADANAVNTGIELAIPLSQLGNPTGDILVLADINGGGDGYLSDQFLPGLPEGTGNVGGGGPYSGSNSSSFNFGSTPNEYFSVPVPEPSSAVLLGLSGLGALLFLRRRK
jgi:PEP-CTERM motif